jgi:hypothetical protein
MTRTIAAARLISTALGVSLALATAALADDTGFASIHTIFAVGNKICLSDHSHNGSGETRSTRKAAEVSAIQSWANFTALEYGSDWSNYGISVKKTGSCSQVSGGWQCSLDATPCRVGRAGYAVSGSVRSQAAAPAAPKAPRKASSAQARGQ